MSLSNEIANILLSMINDTGEAEIKRNEFAEELGCVPSQINYVISSRFTPEQGYIVESRRGGGGYVKITRVNYTSSNLFMQIVNSIGNKIDEKSADAIIMNMHDNGLLSAQEAKIMFAAMNDKCYSGLEPEKKQEVRAEVMKRMLIAAQ